MKIKEATQVTVPKPEATPPAETTSEAVSEEDTSAPETKEKPGEGTPGPEAVEKV